MKKKNILKIGAMALLIGLGSCQKYLDLEPLSQANGEQIWGTASGCRQLLSGTYSLFRRTLLTERPFYLYGDLPSQMVLRSNQWIANYAFDGNYAGSYLYDWWIDWTPYYQVITTANTLLTHIDDIEAREFNSDETAGLAEKRAIEGEAHFICAYAYFWLTRIYSDVPIVKEAIESVDQALSEGATIGKAQSTQTEVLEYCLQHLDAAIAELDYDSPGTDTWAVRADKGAALSLKADVCLWLAHSYQNEGGDYLSMIQMADDCLAAVIANGNRSLVDYSDESAVMAMFDGKSTEGIFELNVSIDQNETYWMSYDWNVHARTWWSENYTNTSLLGSPQSNLVVADASLSQALYPETDLRRNLFFENFGSSNTHTTRPPMLKKYSTGQQVDPSNEGTYFANSNVLLMRLTGIYLLRAEALYKLGQTGNARTLLNEIRRRSGIGNFMGSDGELLAAIIEERARELVGEGHSAFDRIRNDYWEGCDWYSVSRIRQKGQYWPVHTGLFSANRDLVQIPYWQGQI